MAETTIDERLICTCPIYPDAPCGRRMTGEDMLCDSCRDVCCDLLARQ